MTHQNHQTNGASLEDCHTNFFALTDLCGIKWRKFVNGERPNASSDPLEDPILRSYSRCMQADILCVWRRVQSTKQENSDPNALPFEINSSKVHPPLSLAAAKELWIFWYGEEPDLSGVVDAELLKVAANQALWNGTWERGLTYECRSLLFKALHNLMERFVLTKDIVRFGKWFVQPCTSSDRLFGRSSQHLSFSFTFFVHGDTVCASIDLREHPAVRPLTKEHLTEAAAAFSAATNSQQPLSPQSHEQNLPNSPGDTASPHDTNNGTDGNGASTTSPTPKPRKVILAPFGMAATLTGNSFKASDPMTEKILEDWASFFPLCNKENSDVPPVVEVVSGGHKMYHPSIYVLVTDLDDMEEMEAAASQKNSLGTTSSAEAAALAAISTASSNENNCNRRTPINAKLQHLQTHQQQQQQQQQQHPLVTATTVSTSNSVTVVERLHDATKVQPYYDTMTSSFTCNTTNTHAPPQAATEMPERAWQDCITNTLHVTYASCTAAACLATCSTVGASTGVTSSQGDENGSVTNAGCGNGNDSSTDTSSAITNNNSSRTGSANANLVDVKPRLQQLQQQQPQFWGFVDSTQKAPCICTKCQWSSSSSSSKKSSSSSSTTTAVGMSGNSAASPTSTATTMRLSNSLPLAMTKSSHVAAGNNGSSSSSLHCSSHHSHTHHHHRGATSTTVGHAQLSDGSTKGSLRSHRIPFHKRQQFAVMTGSSAALSFNSSSSSSSSNSGSPSGDNVKCQSSRAGGDDSAASAFTGASVSLRVAASAAGMAAGAGAGAIALSGGTLHYQTSDTIPKQRALHTSSGTPHGTPHGGASTYSRNSIGDSMPVPSVGSPGTPAASPHPNSTLSQPTSVPPADQLLNMSPRAPASVSNLQQPSTPIDQLLDKNTPAPTPTDQHDNKSITASPYVHPTPSVEPPPSAEGGHGVAIGGPGSVPQPASVGRCTPTMAQQQQQQQTPTPTPGSNSQQCGTITIKKFEVHQQALTPLGTDIKLESGLALPNNCNRAGTPMMATAATMSMSAADYWKPYKLPQIKVKDIDSFANDDCAKFDVLYDFTFQDAWVNHPMKRFKPNEVAKPWRPMRTKNLYDGHTHSKPLMPSPGSVYGSQLLSIDASSSLISGSGLEHASMAGAGMGGGLVGIAGSSLGGNNGPSGDGSTASAFFQSLDIQTDTLQGTASSCKEAKNSGSGNLYTAEGLNPSLNDLEQLFETSSNDDCGSVQIHTPPDSNNPSNGTATTNTIDDLKRSTAVASAMAAAAAAAGVGAAAAAMVALQNCTGASNAISASTNTNTVNSGSNNSSGANTIQAEDLTKMFPTPPSHEQHHPNSSPCQMDIQMTDLSVITSSTLTASIESGLGGIKIKQEYSVELGSPVEESIQDWSYVYRPPQRAKFVGSSKYAPLKNLPSQTQPPLVVPPNCVYKPSWTTQKSRAAVAAAHAAVAQQQQQQHLQQQQQQQQLQHQHQQLHELLSAAPRTPLQQPRTPLGPIQSPMHPNTVPPPLSSGGSNLLLNQLNCPQAALTNTPGGSAAPNMQQLMHRAGLSPISPAPASVPFPRGSPMMQPQRHPPPPYEMAVASPATSTSSYLNKQYNSQEHPQTPQSVGMSAHHAGRPLSAAGNPVNVGICVTSSTAQELPEVSSLIVNILLYDTALNVFRDHNFDSSTVCVCNADSQKVGNIRGADSGVYVPLPGSSFNPAAPPTGAAVGGAAVGGSGIGAVVGSGGMNMRMLSAFGGAASALDSPASLPGAGSGHTGSNSSSSTTPASNQHITGYVDDDPVDCTCGFSAVVNRRLAYRAGLFYEDELEITNIGDGRGRRKNQSLLSLITSLGTALVPASTKGNNSAFVASINSSVEKIAPQADQQAHAIFDLLLEQCSIIQTSSSSIHRALQRHRRRLAKQNRQPQSIGAIANLLEFVDANDIICLALEQSRLAFENNRMDVNDFAAQHQLSPFHVPTGRRCPPPPGAWRSVHKWPYIPVGFTRSNKEIVRTMNSIQPMLQNAFHSKSRNAAGTKDATYTVSGPLTWRQFHRLAGRASGQCEPQPIPSVIVGHDKDWISVAPLAIHYWDKFLLEPYSYARDVVYLIMCPDNDYVAGKTKTYFKELSTTYEMCKLGRHTPMRGWDGIMMVGPRPAGEGSNSTTLDDWLRTLDDTTLAAKIRLYANAFQNMLAPYLNRIPGDKTLLNPPESSSGGGHSNGRERGTTSPVANMSSLHGVGGNIDAEKSHNSPKVEATSDAQQSSADPSNLTDTKADVKPDVKPAIVLGDPLGMGETMEDINPPAIVLYVVEPFTFGCDSPELERLACIALLRCYSEMLKSIPDSVRANINIQIISLESILELGRTRNRKRFSDEIKCLALNIFSQCRRHLLHAQTVKSLTGFGTAANMEAFLKTKDEKNRQPYKMYTPPYVLAPMHEKNDKTDFSRTSTSMRGLNEQKYSVMYCNYCLSEDQSWLLATVTDDRGELLEKVCINIDVPTRVRRRKVPARRVGLKKLMDFIMGLISQTAQPWRLVIGRIGRIGHGELKSWSYLLSKQNLQKASKQLKDICKQCTLMYPPSILSACLVTLEPDSKLRVMPDQFTPDERFSQISMQNPLSTPQDVTCTHILVFPTSAVCLSFTRQFQNEPQVDLDNDFLNFDEEDENEGFTDLGDLLDWDPQPGRMSNHCSPDRMEDNRSWQSAGCNNFNSTQQHDVEEVGSINQQPLAVGYMVSTAPTGRMPAWFWAACPHLEDVCPVFLKTALHLHVPNIQTTDDILNSTNAHSSATDHPLDSTLTADVLRYVLEGYNALSWLALDSNTHDRLSCLPINVQTLMELYYLVAAIA